MKGGLSKAPARQAERKVKFSTLAKALKWLTIRPGVDNPDLEMATKYLASTKQAGGRILNTQKYAQAKCNLF